MYTSQSPPNICPFIFLSSKLADWVTVHLHIQRAQLEGRSRGWGFGVFNSLGHNTTRQKKFPCSPPQCSTFIKRPGNPLFWVPSGDSNLQTHAWEPGVVTTRLQRMPPPPPPMGLVKFSDRVEGFDGCPFNQMFIFLKKVVSFLLSYASPIHT